jgi:hypothetical protein
MHCCEEIQLVLVFCLKMWSAILIMVWSHIVHVYSRNAALVERSEVYA